MLTRPRGDLPRAEDEPRWPRIELTTNRADHESLGCRMVRGNDGPQWPGLHRAACR